MFTKSETVGRSEFVSICQKDPNSAFCATSGGWEQGWMVFVDPDANGLIADPNSDILHEHKALYPGITANNTVLAAGTAFLSTLLQHEGERLVRERSDALVYTLRSTVQSDRQLNVASILQWPSRQSWVFPTPSAERK